MGEFILALLEPLLEIAAEWLMLQFCSLVIAAWGGVEFIVRQILS